MSKEWAEREWPIFLGDCSEISDRIYRKKTKSIWGLVKFLEALLRGYGQVILANNPVSGLLLMVTLFIVTPWKGLVSLITGSIGLLWSIIIGRSGHDIRSGLTAYNPILVGLFSHHAVPEILQDGTWGLWGAVLIGVILCVYVQAAMDGFLSKWKIPCLALPFIFIMYLLTFGAFHHYNENLQKTNQTNNSDDDSGSLRVSNNMNATKLFGTAYAIRLPEVNAAASQLFGESNQNFDDLADMTNLLEKINEDNSFVERTSNHTLPYNLLNTSSPLIMNFSTPLQPQLLKNSSATPANQNRSKILYYGIFDPFPGKVNASLFDILHGTLHSASAMLGLSESTSLAIIVFVCVMLFSPIMCLFALLGSLLSTITAYYIIHAPEQEVHDGIWGYNGFLIGAALGGYTLILTCRSTLATIFAVMFGVFLQKAFDTGYRNTTLLQYNLAFNIAVISFLLIAIVLHKTMPRPTDLSFPEKERYEYKLVKKQDKRYHNDGVTVKHISVVKMGGAGAGMMEGTKESV